MTFFRVLARRFRVVALSRAATAISLTTVDCSGTAAGKEGAGGSGIAANDAPHNGSTIVCTDGKVELPPDAPALSTTHWTPISPPGFPFDPSTAATGMAVNPCNPSVLYLCTGSFDTHFGGPTPSIFSTNPNANSAIATRGCSVPKGLVCGVRPMPETPGLK